MDETTVWWLLTGVLVAVELMTGTFYLLMLGVGASSGAIAAHLGAGLPTQLVVAALVGGGSVVFWYLRQGRNPDELPAQSNPNVNLDIGELVQISRWKADGTADVQYRGAHWTAIHRAGTPPVAGEHRVAEVVGNRLVVEKT